MLLRREGKRAGRLRILKLLHIADRQALKETGTPILGGQYVAMKHGPLHSEVLDLINGNHRDEPEWSRHFKNEGNYVVLDAEPAVNRLSRHDINLLNTTVDHRAGLDDWQVADETHSFPEWISIYGDPNANTSRRIPLDAIIQGVGRSTEAEEIKADLRDSELFENFFARMETGRS